MENSEKLKTVAPIIKNTVDFYKDFYICLKTFPKKDQYMLGKRCEERILDFMELILDGAGSAPEKKLSILQRASTKLDALKVLLRTAKELKILDQQKYLLLETQAQVIGKMLGGWLKYLN